MHGRSCSCGVELMTCADVSILRLIPASSSPVRVHDPPDEQRSTKDVVFHSLYTVSQITRGFTN